MIHNKNFHRYKNIIEICNTGVDKPDFTLNMQSVDPLQ